jgi:hypothetical protein
MRFFQLISYICRRVILHLPPPVCRLWLHPLAFLVPGDRALLDPLNMAETDRGTVHTLFIPMHLR